MENGEYNHLIDTTQPRPFRSTLRCTHVRNSITTRGIYASKVKTSAAGDYMTVAWPGGIRFSDWPQPPSPSSTLINAAHIEAMNFFASGCQNKEVSLGNFLWELGETVSLVKGISSAFDAVRQWKASKFVGKDFDRYASKSYLSYIYGIAPVINDLEGMYETLRGIDQHIEWLIANSKRPVPVRFVKDLSRSVSLSNSTITDASNFFFRWKGYRAVYRAHAVITYDVSGLSSRILKVRSLLRAFGAMNPVQCFWQGIGGSFMIDWVYNVSSLLENLEIPILIPYRIQDSGYSITIEAELEGLWSSKPVSLGNKLIPTQYLKWRAYHRYPGIPVPLINLPDLTVPGLKQLVSAIAIGMSR